MFIVSCSEDSTSPDIVESEVLATYFEANGDYINTYCPAVITATDLYTLNQTGKAYIIDIRSAADFALGHIAGAKNIAFADVMTHINATDLANFDKVALVCYSGQTASYLTAILRVKGYDKVVALKFGMCSWHSDFASKWKTTVANGNAYASQFVSTAAPAKPALGIMPVLLTGKETGAEILDARVATLFTEGFGPGSISATTVFQNLSNYYIVNYFTDAQFTTVGHIPGAFQYTPKADLKLATFLKTLPTDKTIVVYCHTGTTSANLAAVLRLLGYDAKSLLYGANSMAYDKMAATTGMSVWKDSECKEYAYEK
ncbi:MAG: hypothetical protein A2X64_01765 [Ignavibacteria bacterium GWF2_33_9]|nr:MAG: hypothetical protein A2X64_01765 [Ignavibacteria bacterium GWF2_33_9]